MVPAKRNVHKNRSTRRGQVWCSSLSKTFCTAVGSNSMNLAQQTDDEEVEVAQKFGDLDFAK